MLFKKFDVTLAQATRYFSPKICEMQFVYKKWIDLKKKNNFKLTFADKFSPLLEKYNLKKSKRIIAISDIVKKEIIDSHKINKDKIDVIHSGVNLDFFNPKKRIYRKRLSKKLNFSEKDVILIFVGNPFNRKGLEYAIRSLPLLKNDNYKLLIIGRDNKKPYLDLAKSLAVDTKIIFLDLTPEIDKYFASSDIFLFPTLYEPFGLVILEAMASGLAVITSKDAGASELIDDKKNGIILENPENYKSISENINFLLQNNRRLEEMKKEARKKAEIYSWTTTAKKMLNTFKKASK